MLAIAGLLVFLVLPQVAGWIATRVTRRSSWVTWPAAAIAVFAAEFYGIFWLPAKRAAEASDSHCGTWQVAGFFVLALGLVLHLAVGVVGGLLARRRLRRS